MRSISHYSHHHWQTVWGAVIEYTLGPLIREGVQVHNAHTDEDYVVTMDVAWRVEDSKGIAAAIGCSQFPAYNGSCCQCQVVGVNKYNAMTYPGAVTHLPDNDPLRYEFSNAYAADEELWALAFEAPPSPWVLRDVLKRGKQVSRGDRTAKEAGWKFVDVLTFGLSVDGGRTPWNKIHRTILDPDHQFHNFVKNVICIVGNLKHMAFTKAKRKGEWKLDRFTAQKVPFHASIDCQARINHLCVTLKLPNGWPALSPLFTDCSKFKIAESLALCGDRGVYLFQFLDIDERTRQVLIKSLTIFGELLQKVPSSDARLTAIQEELVVCLATLEFLLPLFWCTTTRHQLLHCVLFITRAGSIWAHNMLKFERMHCLLKDMVRGYKNLMQSVANTYTLLLSSLLGWQFNGEDKYVYKLNRIHLCLV